MKDLDIKLQKDIQNRIEKEYKLMHSLSASAPDKLYALRHHFNELKTLRIIKYFQQEIVNVHYAKWKKLAEDPCTQFISEFLTVEPKKDSFLEQIKYVGRNYANNIIEVHDYYSDAMKEKEAKWVEMIQDDLDKLENRNKLIPFILEIILNEEFIQQLELKLFPFKKDTTPITRSIEWLGSNKNFGELFVELHEKGWINLYPDGGDSDKDYIKNLAMAFGFEYETLRDLFKPFRLPPRFVPQYDNIYHKADYIEKFNGIKKR